MSPHATARTADPGATACRYQRHQPEQSLLYRLIEQHYPALVEHLAAQDRSLPESVQQEFEAFLKCGRLEHGFLRVRCGQCHVETLVAFSCKRRGFCPSCGARRMVESAALLADEVLPREALRQWVLSVPYPLRYLFAVRPPVQSAVLGIVIRTLSTYLLRKAGWSHATAHTGAVTMIQRFGSALNLNVHFHMLFLDGVYVTLPAEAAPRFVPVHPPTRAELQHLTRTLARRIGRHLERRGLLTSDDDQSFLALDSAEAGPLDDVLGHAITYRISVGPNRGRKVFTLQTRPPQENTSPMSAIVANESGFSLHAGVTVRPKERDKLERLCRYLTRPAIAESRLTLTPQGHVRYALKTPYKDGTTHVVFEPLDFMARLAVLVPPPRAHLIRYHGVFAPNSRYRAHVTPAKRGPGRKTPALDEPADRTGAERRAAMTWAQRLKRVFNIDIEICHRCGGAVKIISCIEDPLLIEKILTHLQNRNTTTRHHPPCRAPPAHPN